MTAAEQRDTRINALAALKHHYFDRDRTLARMLPLIKPPAPAVRALYTSDASNYRRVPRIVTTPASAEELAVIVGRAAEAGVPIIPWRGPGSLDTVLRGVTRRSRAPRMVSR